MSDLLQMRIAAESGDAWAQVGLAHGLLLGKPTAEMQQEAMRWVLAACEKNNPDALLLHAVLATIGLGRPRNLNEAHQFVARAAQAGDARALGQLDLLGGLEKFDDKIWNDRPAIKQHFDAPRIFTIENLIPPQVCAWLIRQVEKRLERAKVYADSAVLEMADARANSVGAFRSFEPDVLVHMVNLRIAELTNLPLTCQETTNILHYARGQEYVPHYDFFIGEQRKIFADEIASVGQRIGTFLIYLNDDFEGGETEFPRLDWRFKGKTGDALLFWNVSKDNVLEPDSYHAGLPVKNGEKWILSKWLRPRQVPFI